MVHPCRFWTNDIHLRGQVLLHFLGVLTSQDMLVANEYLRQTRLNSGIVAKYGDKGEISTIIVEDIFFVVHVVTP